MLQGIDSNSLKPELYFTSTAKNQNKLFLTDDGYLEVSSYAGISSSLPYLLSLLYIA